MKLFVVCLDNGEWLTDLSTQTFQDFECCIIKPNRIDLCTLINEKIQSISSDYLVFVHEDVVSLPDRFQEQVSYLDDNEKIAAVGSYVNVFKKNKVTNILQYPDTPIRCYGDFYLRRQNFVFDYAVMMRHSSFMAAGGMSRIVRNSERQLHAALFLSLWARIMHTHGKFSNIKKSLVQCNFLSTLHHEDYIGEKDLVWGMFRRKTFQIQPLQHLSNKLFGML